MLGEANRVDAGCPFVAWQMGLAMVATSNDPTMVLRVMQKALGPRGLPLWLSAPPRAWIEAFPQGRSFVRRLAEKYAYSCPLLGGDLRVLIRLGEQAVAQAHYRVGNFQESADLFNKLLGESAPTLPLLRGLGLSLTRLGRYDQAYKHLRAAVEMDPQHALTAGYLALCGARGRPQQPEDKPKNVAWAIRQVARFEANADPEYAALVNTIFGEARALNMAVGQDDQVRLCNLLVSVRAIDPEAAAAYAHLALDFPDAVAPEYAWLYCRASVEQGVRFEHDHELFARTFRDRAAAQGFFARQGWDLGQIEYTFLERCAVARPGRFPQELGTEYAQRGEAFLLEHSQKQEQAGDLEGALTSVTILARLAPRSLPAHDRAACLHHRRREPEKALSYLEAWQRLEPGDPLPCVRRAVIEQQRGDWPAGLTALRQALSLACGPTRASIAFLGARLALAATASPSATASASSGNGLAQPIANGETVQELGTVRELLLECLREQPDHPDALWTLAAIHALTGDQAGLVELTSRMDRPEVKDARFHYLAAIAHLAAGDPGRALEAARRAGADSLLSAESQYVQGWAHLGLGDQAAAAKALRFAAADNGPSADHARALLGQLGLQRGDCAEAATWWNALDAGRRTEWNLDDPLRQTVLLAGLLCLRGGKYEEAAERFREAGKLGLRDRRLGPLISLSLFRAGQRLLYEVSDE